jgi:hypothetical protein
MAADDVDAVVLTLPGMALPLPQRWERHPDFADLGFICSCGARTRSQLDAWTQWYVSGECWWDVCGSCGRNGKSC